MRRGATGEKMLEYNSEGTKLFKTSTRMIMGERNRLILRYFEPRPHREALLFMDGGRAELTSKVHAI